MARRPQGLLPPALTRRLTKEEAKRLGVSHAAKLYVDAALERVTKRTRTRSQRQAVQARKGMTKEQYTAGIKSRAFAYDAKTAERQSHAPRASSDLCVVGGESRRRIEPGRGARLAVAASQRRFEWFGGPALQTRQRHGAKVGNARQGRICAGAGLRHVRLPRAGHTSLPVCRLRRGDGRWR